MRSGFTFTGPWEVKQLSIEDFLVGMSSLGTPQEVQMVGSFAPATDDRVRTAHRDVDLPLHRDGVYTKAIADMQRGKYVERPNVDIIGMYCVRRNSKPCEQCNDVADYDCNDHGYCSKCSGTSRIDLPCYTLVSEDGVTIAAEVDLQAGEALIMDNRWWHGRRGAVGERLLIRFWVTKAATPIA